MIESNKTFAVQYLSEAVTEATNCISPYRPLTNFVACNALQGFENVPFEKSMKIAKQLFGARGFLPLSDYRSMYEAGRIEPRALEEAFRNNAMRSCEHQRESQLQTISEMLDQVNGSRLVSTINRHMIKWCGAFLDSTQAQWAPEKTTDFYRFWKEHACYDLSMRWLAGKSWVNTIDELPEGAEDALHFLLSDFGVQQEDAASYLRQHVIQLPGFASYLKWREENGDSGILAEYLAVRLVYERCLSRSAAVRLDDCSVPRLRSRVLESKSATNRHVAEDDDYGPVWQDAYELSYRNRLLSLLDVTRVTEKNSCCQMVFCIDVRSEPIRRELEKVGPYSTYGFAGFFAVPMRLLEAGSKFALDLCPVLLSPTRQVKERTDTKSARRKSSWQALKTSVLLLKKKVKCSFAGTFGLVELTGVWSSIPLLTKTLVPRMAARWLSAAECSFADSTVLELDSSAFSLSEKIDLAEGVVRGIGFTCFRKVIVLCGHKSSSVNNPYASALDCGACGGHGGGYSARLAAEFLNDSHVRNGLRDRGINIPADTLFLAAEHDTTTDLFNLFGVRDLSDDYRSIVDNLKKDLLEVGKRVRRRRLDTLPASCFASLNDPLLRASDWAQVAPEWGLAGNAAFIAGPRSLTEACDLEGRVFLHSYEHGDDRDGKILELIMTAPLVVAQWINMQYYLSTVDNRVFGSGSKVLHNVIGDFGVMQGASSDLRIGLPEQAVATSSGLRHEPMRLLSIINAPLASIDQVLNKHERVRQLVSNRWIKLVAIDPANRQFYEADDVGVWRRIEAPDKVTAQFEHAVGEL